MSTTENTVQKNLNEKGQMKLGKSDNFDKDPAWDIKDIVGKPLNLTALISFKYTPEKLGKYDKPDENGKIEKHIATFKPDIEKKGEKRHRSFVPKSIVSHLGKKVPNIYKLFEEGVETESIVFFKETMHTDGNDFWTFVPEEEFKERKKKDVFVPEKFTFERK